MPENTRIRTKFDQIYDRLLGRIGREMAVGDRLPPEQDLARSLGVNRMTVAKVMSTLKREGYVSRKPRVGTLVSRRPRCVPADGIITVLPADIQSLHDFYFKSVADAVADEALRRGLIGATLGGALDKKRIFERIGELYFSGRYSGVVVVNSLITEREAWQAYYKNHEEPRSVWMGMSSRASPNVNCVDTDQSAGVLLGLEFLLAKGFRRIGFMSSVPDTYDRRERLEAFKRICAEKGLCRNDGQIILIDVKSIQEAGYRGFKRLSELTGKFDALFLADCGLLEGLEMLRKEGHASGGCKLPMAAFDYRFGGMFDRMVQASIVQPIEDMGRTAVRMLTNLYGGKARPPLRTLLKPKLMEKGYLLVWR